MDSQIDALTTGRSQWTSHVAALRAPPLSVPGGGSAPTTSGVQVWIKDIGVNGTALLLVNVGNVPLDTYELDLTLLPKGRNITAARDLYTHAPYAHPVKGGQPLKFSGVGPHDSVFLVLS
jgi:hypothetical protein